MSFLYTHKVGMFDLTNASHQEAIEAFEEQQKTLRTSLIIQSFISKSLKVIFHIQNF